MSTIRKHRDKYQVQIRRKGHRPISKTFHQLKDAQEWARWMEVQADRGESPKREPPTPEIKLADLIKKYISEIVPTKKSADNEVIFLGAFLRHKICSKRVDRLRVADFASYRDERLKTITPNSLKRQLAPISHAFEIARTEWGE